ncbi:MAG: chromate efflux transporter [Bacteroidales bacterium]
MEEKNQPIKSSLKEIGLLFLKLGSIAFGGPAAHIAMMEDEVVKKRKWMSHEHFLDLVGATNLIPGPNSTEMTMHCGNERAGWKGLVVAGVSFILPAVIITMVFAFLYQKYGKLPEMEPFIYGIKPAVISIIVFAVYNLGKKALKNIELGILGAATLLATLLGVNEIAALFVAGFLGLVLYFIKSSTKNIHGFVPFLSFSFFQSLNLNIFWIFLKVGSILYGSGYVLFAFLDSELVTTGLLSRQELIDAIAVGQFTPGPVLSTATFVGWQLNGFLGAILATIGIFIPSFLFVALLNPIIPKLRKSKYMSAFLDAINIASVAVILSVTIVMSKETITDWRTIAIALLSFGAIIVFKKLNSAFVVIVGVLAGYILYFV